MRRNFQWTLLGGLGAWAGVALLGCAEEQSNGLPSRAGTTAAAATAPARPVGPFPRGTPNPASSPDPATVGPEIEVIAPARGAQVSANQVEVRVRCSDPDGVAGARIAGAPAASGALPGEFVAQVGLVPGLNIIDIQATDGLGNVSTSYVSCAHGTFVPDDQPLQRSVGLSLTQAGLDRVAAIAQQQTSTLNLYSLVSGANPLLKNFALKVEALGLAHDPLRFQLGGTPAGIEIVVTLENLNLKAKVEVFGGTLTRADITSSRVTLRATAIVDRSALTGNRPGKRALGLEIDQVGVALEGFRVRTPSGALNLILVPFQGMLKNMVTDKLRDMILDVADQYLSASLAGVDTPLTVQVPDPLNNGGRPREVDLLARVDEARGFNQAGLGIVGGLQATPKNPVPGAARQVLVTGAALPPQVFGPEGFTLTVGSDALNGLLHALYATGSLEMTIDGTNPTPDFVMPMAVKVLYPFLPPVRDVAPDPNTPIVMEISIQAAPVVRLGLLGASQYGVHVGEATVKVLIDYMDGGPRAELFTLHASVDASAQMDIRNNELVVRNLDITNLRADITREPLVDLADQEVEDFIESALPSIAKRFTSTLPAFPIPGLPWGLQLRNARLETAPGLLRLHGDL